MAFFALKLGLDLEMRAAHPHQKFPEIPPPPPSTVFWEQHQPQSIFKQGSLALDGLSLSLVSFSITHTRKCGATYRNLKSIKQFRMHTKNPFIRC